MPTIQELERLDLTVLAERCQRVADSPSADSSTMEKARELKPEWVRLIASETPPPPDLNQYQDIQARKKSLKERMVDFLAVNL